ncbi:fungal-specific transcription factor domain-containing protein [Phaeosphaeria sp. MPI-PUGE-AT-0046c]|nr:fungal-specific transcription factor domain-containing protein [Phaeosphaeria sp. MPI-PUGE-AT-0046c]
MSTAWNNFSVSSSGSQVGDDDVPACASCKKRKLRCSRETPTCSHCQRLATECVYNPKQRPGLKPGAVEALTRRVAFLEQILLDDVGNIRPQYNPTIEDGDDRHRDEYANTAEAASHQNQHNDDDGVNMVAAQNGSKDSQQDQTSAPVLSPLKRKFDQTHIETWPLGLDDVDVSQHLPNQTILLRIAEFFCISFHHWIPCIHKQRLQTRVQQGVHDAGFDLVLHAIVCVSLRHMSQEVLFLDHDQIKEQIRRSRLIVETMSIRSCTKESLQALILVVFDHLNNGQAQRAWPLIGSLTRTIDYLQLTTEPTTSSKGSLMRPLRLIPHTNDWTELEERRRLFWVVFLLDRLCSISTGWNTSLTADDVHRRLPADGGYFTREEPVTTPFFGIWNKHSARIGRSLANVPAQYNEDDPVELPPGYSPTSANGYIDASKLGAFAYAVEATESLSQVTTFFLQQPINWQDKDHALNWLTRFKELDLRLVHWKSFLPQKWNNCDISADRAVVDMDPNLTLAHLTHNTSMIFLHHPIAFPPTAWKNYVALPRECSAQTCELASVETSNIVDKFLAHTAIPFVNAQFSFCTYVAAKALLFDHHRTQRPLRPEFQQILRNLLEISTRWRGHVENLEDSQAAVDQASVYARHLQHLLDSKRTFDLYDHSCTAPDTPQYASPISVSTPQYSQTVMHTRNSVSSHKRQNSMSSSQSVHSPRRASTTTVAHSSTRPDHPDHLYIQGTSAPSVLQPSSPFVKHRAPNSYTNYNYPLNGIGASTNAFGPTPFASQQMPSVPNESMQDQSLLTLSDTLLDAQFLDMDRVITFEDANFFMPF